MTGVHFRTALSAMFAVGCVIDHSTSHFEHGAAGTFSSFGAGGAPFVPGSGGAGGGVIFVDPIPPLPDVGAPCEPSRRVDSKGRALLVKDPEVLAEFPLERVLGKIIETAEGAPPITPTELLQHFFDTENDPASAAFPSELHCRANAAAVDSKTPQCPRAEGKLAKSTGFFTAGDPDSFVPVALVNRFDLTPSNKTTCGEYRIVYAKQSGFTDPKNRLFLIFEAALENSSGTLSACRPVAELWAGLETAEPADAASRLEAFFFDGLSGQGVDAVLQAGHFGDQRGPCSYAGACGQIRVGQGMQEPWELRQFRVGWSSQAPVRILPVPVTSSVRPELFNLDTSSEGSFFRNTYLLQRQLRNLTGAVLPRLLLTDSAQYEATQSALAGPAAPDYAARLDTTDPADAFKMAIDNALTGPSSAACPIEYPLTADAVIERLTALSCGGCHSPETLLSPGRQVGCGLVWPRSLGETHISERGELSEALTDVFLPHRAGVLETYLRACDANAIADNLQPSPSNVRIECFVAGTPVTMADGSTKPIERVETGDSVLSFDETTHALLAARVQRTVVRRDADHLVAINDELVATDNHPFRTARGWVRAEALRVGDTLVRAQDLGPGGGARFEMQPAAVESLSTQPGTVDTYNLDVATTHGYFAGGFLVHDRP